jgi:putative spermidine/putrescine transport system substrate-binding protein
MSADFRKPPEPHRFQDITLSRRRFLGRSAALIGGSALVPGLLAACGGGDETSASGTGTSAARDWGDEPFVVADWGGNTATARLQTWGAAFTEETGVPVTNTALDYGKFQAQIESGNVTWNWIDAEGWFVFASDDLLEDIPYDKIGITEADLVDVENSYLPKGVLSYHSAYAIGHRTEGDLKPPADWVEFFDTRSVPGKRALFNWPYGTIEIALIADGVAYDDLYPLDLDRAFNKIDSIRDDLVFWNTGAESQQFLVNQSADFVQAWHNRIAYLAAGGLPVGLQWGQNLQILTHHTISKGQPRPDLCAEYIRVALEPRPLAQYSTASLNAPPTPEAYELLDDATKGWMSTNPDHMAVTFGVIDDQWWGENIDSVSTSWYEWVGV